MSGIAGFISFMLFIALIIGLIKPAIILRWDNKPSRWKVFGYWLLSSFIIISLIVLTTSDEDIAEANIKTARNNIENKDYESAISTLNSIEEDNPLYKEVQTLIKEADSLNEITKKQRALASEVLEEKKADEEKSKQKQQLEREIASINDGIDFSTYRGDLDALHLEIALFGFWAKTIIEGQSSDDPNIQYLSNELKKKVVKLQVREFPKLRLDYAKVVAKKLWENDIEVHANGSNYRIINFTSGAFAANKNKKDFHEQVYKTLKRFRFSQAQYRWYKGADEYTYWETATDKDLDIVIID